MSARHGALVLRVVSWPGLVAEKASRGMSPAIAKMPGKQRGGKEERIPSWLIPQDNSSQWSLMLTK